MKNEDFETEDWKPDFPTEIENVKISPKKCNETYFCEIIKEENPENEEFSHELSNFRNKTILEKILDPLNIESNAKIQEYSNYKCKICHTDFSSMQMLKIHKNIFHQSIKILKILKNNIHEDCYVKIEKLEMKKKNVSIISADIPGDLLNSYYYDLLDAQGPLKIIKLEKETDKKSEDNFVKSGVIKSEICETDIKC